MTIDSKQALRARLRAARDAFVAGKPSPIAVPDAFRARLDRGLTVTSYVPIGSEADPSPLARAAVAAGCVLALPHVTVRSEPMRFLAWETEAVLEAGFAEVIVDPQGFRSGSMNEALTPQARLG